MFTKLSLYGILTFLSTTSAFALTCANNYGGTTSCVNNTQTAGDCTSLGYSKDGCDHFLYCPFDKAYKKCVSGSSLSAYDIPCSQLGFTQENKTDWCSQIISCPQDSSYTLCAQTKYAKDCSDYPLDKCPEGATGCSSCSDGVKISYRINGCKEGYSPNGISCSINNCTDYTLKKCPTGAASRKYEPSISGTCCFWNTYSPVNREAIKGTNLWFDHTHWRGTVSNDTLT